MSKPFSPQHLLVNVMPEARTELSTLLGSLSLLKPELTQPSQLQILAGAETASQNLFAIMQKLADLGDLNHNQLEVQRSPVHVSKLLHRLALLYSERATACGVEFDVEVDPNLASIALDQQKLYRVIANILDYALASARPGTFRITVTLPLTVCWRSTCLILDWANLPRTSLHLQQTMLRLFGKAAMRMARCD